VATKRHEKIHTDSDLTRSTQKPAEERRDSDFEKILEECSFFSPVRGVIFVAPGLKEIAELRQERYLG